MKKFIERLLNKYINLTRIRNRSRRGSRRKSFLFSFLIVSMAAFFNPEHNFLFVLLIFEYDEL